MFLVNLSQTSRLHIYSNYLPCCTSPFVFLVPPWAYETCAGRPISGASRTTFLPSCGQRRLAPLCASRSFMLWYVRLRALDGGPSEEVVVTLTTQLEAAQKAPHHTKRFPACCWHSFSTDALGQQFWSASTGPLGSTPGSWTRAHCTESNESCPELKGLQ